MNKEQKQFENGIKIASINGAEVLKIKAGKEGEIKYNTVFSNSLLLDKLKKEGLEISKQGSTKDIINVKFDYGYTEDEAKELMQEYNNIKANNKTIKKDNKNDINRIKQLNLMIKKAKCELKVFKNDIRSLTDEKEINKMQKKIDTRNSKIVKYKEELKNIDCKVFNELDKNNNNMADLQKQIDAGIKKKGDIRDLLYNEGFELDIYKTVNKKKVYDKTIKYKYWFRTGGKAKNGTDYFINSELFSKIDEWQRMGIPLPEKDCKLVEMEVYKSLISSALVKDNCYLTIKPSEILVVKDLKSFSNEQKVIKIIRDSDTGYSKAVHTKEKCENVLWDGMALLQKDDSIGLSEGFRGLRHHFYKTAGFIVDFQLYFQDFYKDDYENAYVKDMFGREVKVSSIKMITTNNAMKWIKFLGATKEAFEQWSKYLEENCCKFGICKENHSSKYGDKQRMSYQMLQTLDVDVNSLQDIFKDSLDYIKKLQNDDNFFIEHLKRTANTTNNNTLLVDLATTYKTFVNSYMFKDVRKQEIHQYKESLKRGKLLSEGENETIVGNILPLLEYVTGQLDEYIKGDVLNDKYIDKSLPKLNSCYCLRFENKQKICGMRSPHNSGNNIMMFENNITPIMDRYCKSLGNNVIVANMIGNDIQFRGNGLDTDLDFLYCSVNKTIVEAGEKAQQFPTIINGFELAEEGENKIVWNNTMEDRAKVDNILQASQKSIGTSSNVAMLYLTQYWHLVNKYKNNEIEKAMEDYNYYWLEGYKDCRTKEEIELEEKLLDNVCILSVLAQCAVDASKRRYICGTGDNGLNDEIERLRKELLFKEKPTFWQYTSSSFRNDEIEKKLKKNDKEAWKLLNKKEKSLAIKEKKKNMINNLYDYDCPMNLLLKEIDKIEDAKYGQRIKDDNFIVMWGNKKTQFRNKALKIEETVEEFQNACNYLNATENFDDEEVNKFYSLLYKEYLDRINGLSLNLETMSLIVARALSTDNKFLKNDGKIKTKLLNILYKKDRDNFMKCFDNCNEEILKKKTK